MPERIGKPWIMRKSDDHPPRTLKEWLNDIPNGGLYGITVFDNQTVCTWCGRYAHSSGSASCTWTAFIEGELHGVVVETMGKDVLDRALSFVTSELSKTERK